MVNINNTQSVKHTEKVLSKPRMLLKVVCESFHYSVHLKVTFPAWGLLLTSHSAFITILTVNMYCGLKSSHAKPILTL